MQNNANKIGTELVFPDLSYKILGASFRVFNNLGWGLSEKIYQLALAKEFENEKICFRREEGISVKYGDSKISQYFADFLVENKILLELKVVRKLGYAHTKQTLGYLRASGIKLGILLYFSPDGVKFRRVLNSMV